MPVRHHHFESVLPRIKPVILAGLLAMLVASCSSSHAPIASFDEGESAAARAEVADAADEDEAAPSTTTTTLPGPTLGLITSTGVTVAVRHDDNYGYHVITPCGDNATVADGSPLQRARIVLDPGHGGGEVGAVGFNQLAESDLNLTLAEVTAEKLKADGISTELTRTADYRIPLANRVAFAQHLEAEALISIHHNGPNAGWSDEPGTEVFVPQSAPEAQRLGGLLHQAVFEALDGFIGIRWSSAADAGVFAVINQEGEDAYGIVRHPEIPVALIEMGYLSNHDEAVLYASDQYLDVASDALVEAIEGWLNDAELEGTAIGEPRYFSPGGTGGTAGCEDPELG